MSGSIINHVMQTLADNCVSASLAMITGIDIDNITRHFHEDYLEGTYDTHEMLTELGIKYRHCLSSERVLKPNHVYIVHTPSLNIRGGMHSIVIQMNVAGDSWWVFDPNSGKKGKRVYDNNFNLVSWCPDFEFTIDDILEFRQR